MSELGVQTLFYLTTGMAVFVGVLSYVVYQVMRPDHAKNLVRSWVPLALLAPFLAVLVRSDDAMSWEALARGLTGSLYLGGPSVVGIAFGSILGAASRAKRGQKH